MECFAEDGGNAVPLVLLTADRLAGWLESAPERAGAWVRANRFDAEDQTSLGLPSTSGEIERVLVGLGSGAHLFSLGGLPKKLDPDRTYAIDGNLPGIEATDLAIGWALGSYRFDRYRAGDPRARLVLSSVCDAARVAAIAESVCLGRDLINTPAEDMGPAELAAAAEELAAKCDAEFQATVGDDLLDRNYPSIHAVGRASHRAPRLIDIRWGDPAAPRLTLVGKGVCFDSGGLDLKTASGMKMMKKDMGGGASVLALAGMIMRLGLKVRLRVLVPAVENSVAGNAFRPLDVITTRKGITVEIGNTDAEGRVVLADALAEASSEKPDLLIDMATLTGAARVALGPDLPAMFTNDDDLAEAIESAGAERADPVWRLPLWQAYGDLIKGEAAEISNTGSSPYGGAITAALFLERFVDDGIPWAHFDIMGWNLADKPGRPQGGEPMAVRGLFAMLEDRYGR